MDATIPLQGIEPQLLCRPARRVVAISAGLCEVTCQYFLLNIFSSNAWNGFAKAHACGDHSMLFLSHAG
jgi:hypothetical protein